MKPQQLNLRSGLRLSVGAAVVLLLAACASSDGIAPTTPLVAPSELGLASSETVPVAGFEDDWWAAWEDAELSRLMALALQSHPNLQVAQARLAKAGAAVGGEQAADGPGLGFDADVTRQHYSANSIYPSPLGGSTRTLANVQLAGHWEMDFFGRHRAAIGAAVGAQRAAQAEWAAARNVLTGQIAQIYVQLGQLLAQRAVAQRALDQRVNMLALIRQRVDAGLDTQVELRQGEGALPEARLQIEQIDEQLTHARHALAALAGVAPDALAGFSPALPGAQALAMPAVLPVDLLGRRPDIAAARWRIEAATQGMQAAKAEFYPNVSLTAFVGLSSLGLGNLVEAGSRQYGVGPAIHLPIFDAGSLRANLKVRAADVDLAVAAYNGAVVQAVRDTADQLASLRSLARQGHEQQQAQAAAEATYDFAQQRYRAGLSGYLTLLSAESAVLAQRRQAVDLQSRVLLSQGALIGAVGGGVDWAPSPSADASRLNAAAR
jgi:NodT family efflux transporter outer membrane factor (OMF) lipoprotein